MLQAILLLTIVITLLFCCAMAAGACFALSHAEGAAGSLDPRLTRRPRPTPGRPAGASVGDGVHE
jgi:hypothetical protein